MTEFDELNPTEKPQKLVKVYSTFSAEDARIIQNALENDDIVSMIDNEHQAGLTGVLAVKLYVNEKDAVRARQIIEESQD